MHSHRNYVWRDFLPRAKYKTANGTNDAAAINLSCVRGVAFIIYRWETFSAIWFFRCYAAVYCEFSRIRYKSWFTKYPCLLDTWIPTRYRLIMRTTFQQILIWLYFYQYFYCSIEARGRGVHSVTIRSYVNFHDFSLKSCANRAIRRKSHCEIARLPVDIFFFYATTAQN